MTMQNALVEHARNSIKKELKLEQTSIEDDCSLKMPSQGVFVTLYNKENHLRGCIGHLAPAFNSIGEEIESCALASAFQDPRFNPVKASEIDELKIEISLLQPESEVTDKSELDPKKYGVILTSGTKRGVLLPDIDGVDTVEEQITITLQKAGIRPEESYNIHKFEVKKITDA